MVTPTADTGRPADHGGPSGDQRMRRPARLALGTSVGLLGEAVLGYHHPVVDMISIACDVGLPALLSMVLTAIILFGNETRQERAFRLLRWIADKPEPPAPVTANSNTASISHKTNLPK